MLEAKINNIIARLGASKHGKEFGSVTDIGANHLLYVYNHVTNETRHILGSDLKALLLQQDYTITAVTN